MLVDFFYGGLGLKKSFDYGGKKIISQCVKMDIVMY